LRNFNVLSSKSYCIVLSARPVGGYFYTWYLNIVLDFEFCALDFVLGASILFWILCLVLWILYFICTLLSSSARH